MSEQAVGSVAFPARVKRASSLSSPPFMPSGVWDTLGGVILFLRPKRLREGEEERKSHHFEETPMNCRVPPRGYSHSSRHNALCP